MNLATLANDTGPTWNLHTLALPALNLWPIQLTTCDIEPSVASLQPWRMRRICGVEESKESSGGEVSLDQVIKERTREDLPGGKRLEEINLKMDME